VCIEGLNYLTEGVIIMSTMKPFIIAHEEAHAGINLIKKLRSQIGKSYDFDIEIAHTIDDIKDRIKRLNIDHQLTYTLPQLVGNGLKESDRLWSK